MTKFSPLLVVIILAVVGPLSSASNAHAQQNVDGIEPCAIDSHECATELVDRGKAQKRTGAIVGISGAVASTVGIVLFTRMANDEPDGLESLDRMPGVLGVTALTTLGAVAAVTGLVLFEKGRNKESRGRSMQLRLGTAITPSGGSATLVGRF